MDKFFNFLSYINFDTTSSSNSVPTEQQIFQDISPVLELGLNVGAVLIYIAAIISGPLLIASVIKYGNLVHLHQTGEERKKAIHGLLWSVAGLMIVILAVLLMTILPKVINNFWVFSNLVP